MGDTLAGYRPRSQVFALAAELVQKSWLAHSPGPGGGGLGGARDTRRCNCVRIVMAQRPMLATHFAAGLAFELFFALSHTHSHATHLVRQRTTATAEEGALDAPRTTRR
jgi:hypothetical protein